MKIYMGVFLYLLVFSASANTIHPIEHSLSLCLSKDENMNTMSIKQCTYEATNAWDKELNRVYNKLMNELTPAGKSTLKLSQRQWLKFRDHEIKFLINMYDREIFQGSMYSLMRANNIMRLTKERTLHLTSYEHYHDN